MLQLIVKILMDPGLMCVEVLDGFVGSLLLVQCKPFNFLVINPFDIGSGNGELTPSTEGHLHFCT